MTNDLARIQVALEVETARLQAELDKVNRKFDKFGKKSERTASLAKKAFIGLGTAIPVAALAAATKYSLDYADGIADAAEKTAFGVRELQELRYAAEQSGVGVAELEGGLARFTKRLGLARRGTGAAAKAYKDLGLDLSQTNNQVFRQVVETLASMESETDRLAMATRFFGDDAQRLGVLFKDGNRGLQEYADKAHALGLVLSDDLVQGASDANDELSTMKQVLNVQFTRAFVELAPIITKVGQSFADAAPKVAKFFDSFNDPGEQSVETLKETARQLQEEYNKTVQQIEAYNNASSIEKVLFGNFGNGLEKKKERIRTEFDEIIAMIGKAYQKQNVVISGASGAPPALTFKGGETDKLVEKYNSAYLSMQKTADLVGVSTEYEKTLWEVQNGRFKDLGANQQQALLDAAQRIDQRQAELTATEDAAKAEDEAAKAVEKLNAQLDAQADRWRDIVNPAQGVYDQMAELDLLLETGRISWETYGDAMFQVMGEVEGEAKKVEHQWEELGLTFSSAFEDAIVSGESLSDILKGLEQDLLRIFTRKLVTEPLGNFASDIAGDLFSFEGGGYTGSGARVGGLDGKGGYLAMLHPQETVVDHTKRQRSGMQVINNISISAPDGRISNESMTQLQARLGRSMQRSLARNS